MNNEWVMSLWNQSRQYWWIPVASLLMLVVVLVGCGVAVVMIPADYFREKRPSLLTRLRESSILMGGFLVLKNLLALVFFVAGVLMLVLPGQGLLAILVSLILLDFPKKKRLERWLIRISGVRTTVDRLRVWCGRPRLDIPGDEEDGS